MNNIFEGWLPVACLQDDVSGALWWRLEERRRLRRLSTCSHKLTGAVTTPFSGGCLNSAWTPTRGERAGREERSGICGTATLARVSKTMGGIAATPLNKTTRRRVPSTAVYQTP